MARCDLCVNFDDCPWRSDPDAQCSAFKRKPMSNADKIRAMSDEELAEYIASGISRDVCNPPDECEDCATCFLDWLIEEITDD